MPKIDVSEFDAAEVALDQALRDCVRLAERVSRKEALELRLSASKLFGEFRREFKPFRPVDRPPLTLAPSLPGRGRYQPGITSDG